MKRQFFALCSIVFSTLVLPLVLMNCARESMPVGGDRDTIAPIVIKEKPRNNSLETYPQKVIVSFNENISLDKIQENTLISPMLPETPKISAKRNKLTIDLKNQQFAENTTYSFLFAKAIKDLNEGNVLEQYTYAFSTGKQIDTMQIHGKVSLAFEGTTPKNAFVLLYDNLHDSVFTTVAPRYVTRVKQNGSFSFTNIAPLSYRIFALEDANKDYIFNQPSEKIAFLDSIIVPSARLVYDTVWFARAGLSDSLSALQDSFAIVQKTRWYPEQIELRLFENTPLQQKIINSKRVSKYTYALRFSKPVDLTDLNLAVDSYTANAYSIEQLPQKDSVLIWFIDTSIIYAKKNISALLSYTPIEGAKRKTDSLIITPFKEYDVVLQADFSKNSSMIFKGDSLVWVMHRPVAQVDASKIIVAMIKDTNALVTDASPIIRTVDEYNKYFYKTNVQQEIIYKPQHSPKAVLYSPKIFYDSQGITAHKTGLNRFALYFSQVFDVADVTIQMLAFPEMKDWGVVEYDVSTNALLCWITNPQAMRLKNPAFTVTYSTRASGRQSQTIHFNEDISPTEMYKNVRTGKLLAVVSETQKQNAYVNNTIDIICNNPIHSFIDSLFTLIDPSDSIPLSRITHIERLPNSQRVLRVNYTPILGKTLQLQIQRNAITDVYFNTLRNTEMLIKTQQKAPVKYYVPVVHNVTQQQLTARTFSTIANWNPSTNYICILQKGAYTDIYGGTNDSISFLYGSPKLENYGSLFVKVPHATDNLLMQLEARDAKKDAKPYTARLRNGVFEFVNIAPGEYKMYAIVDENGNGRWDAGSYELKQQPEKIIRYKQQITIKPFWENTIEWVFDF